MAWQVQFTDEFERWWNSLDEDEQAAVDSRVRLLETFGPNLNRPHADSLYGSKYNLKELRIQYKGHPYRVFFAVDPRRVAVLLVGGDKHGNDRFYEKFIPRAETIYAQHLREISTKKGK